MPNPEQAAPELPTVPAARRASRVWIGLTIAFGAISVVLVFLLMRRAPPAVGPSFAYYLDTLGVERTNDFPRELPAGTVLRREKTHMTLVATPDEAFEDPTAIKAEPLRDVGGSGSYVDKLEWEGSTSTSTAGILGVGDLLATFKSKGVETVVTKVSGVKKQEPSEVKLEAARLKEPIRKKFGDGTGVFFARSVYTASDLRVSYKRSNEASADLDLKMIAESAGAKGRIVSATETELQYSNVVLGAVPGYWVAADGAGVTPNTVRRIAAELAEAGVPTQVIGEGRGMFAETGPGQAGLTAVVSARVNEAEGLKVDVAAEKRITTDLRNRLDRLNRVSSQLAEAEDAAKRTLAALAEAAKDEPDLAPLLRSGDWRGVNERRASVVAQLQRRWNPRTVAAWVDFVRAVERAQVLSEVAALVR